MYKCFIFIESDISFFSCKLCQNITSIKRGNYLTSSRIDICPTSRSNRNIGKYLRDMFYRELCLNHTNYLYISLIPNVSENRNDKREENISFRILLGRINNIIF